MVEAVSVTTPNGAVELHAGDEVGGWTVIGLVGSGGSASVYRARPTDLAASGSDDFAALRICRPTDRRHLEAILATYEHTPSHPNVVTVHDSFVHRSQGHEHVVCITELSEGGTLADRLVDGLLDQSEARTLADHLIGGLEAYHQGGEVHGDVKPSNVMKFGAHWKLVDPSATERSISSTTSSVVTHERTLRYVAPEALDTPGRTRRAGDVWALGVTLHEALAGSPPFDSMADQVVANCRIDPSVPSDLADLIEACVAPIESRVKTASALRNLPPSRSVGRRSRVRRNVVLASAAVAAATIGLVIATSWPGSTADEEPGVNGSSDAQSSTSTSTVGPTATTTEDGVANSTGPSEQPVESAGESANVATTAALTAGESTSGESTSGESTTTAGAAGNPSDGLWQGQLQADFEDGAEGIVSRVAPVAGAPAPLIKSDGDGNARLVLGSTNRSDTYYLIDDQAQEPVQVGAKVSVQAEVRMVYHLGDEFGIDGPVHGFILKTIPSDDGSVVDAYVASAVPTDQGIQMRVGVTKDAVAPSEAYQYLGPGNGHTAMAEKMVFPAVINQDGPESGSTVELGYWLLLATLSADDDGVRITVELTNPAGGTEVLEWVDTGSERYSGPGSVGLATYGVWSIEPRFDDLLITGG